jgi:hypothetical protein
VGGSTPATTPPVVTAGGTTAGGTTAGTTAGAGGVTAGTSGALGGLVGGGSISVDAGVALPPAAGGTTGSGASAGDAGASVDAGDGGLPSGDAGDAQVPDAGGDGGCATLGASDAGMCPGYGCRTSMQQLRLAVDSEGACASNQALAVACEGRATNAAHQCTQENVFSLNASRAISTCLKRDPQLAMLGTDCLDCFVDEALCTLSRCFAACTVSDAGACQACRLQQCGAPLAVCTGLPTP